MKSATRAISNMFSIKVISPIKTKKLTSFPLGEIVGFWVKEMKKRLYFYTYMSSLRRRTAVIKPEDMHLLDLLIKSVQLQNTT